MKSLLPLILRLLFPGPGKGFEFKPFSGEVFKPDGDAVDLYIHLPFCRRLCRFCPYVKVPYDAGLVAAYGAAVLTELEACREKWGPVKINSVYFGGGSPSVTPEIIEESLSRIADSFGSPSEIGVEIHPLDVDYSIVSRLRKSGVNMASLGVQSFNDQLLEVLGRGYDAATARLACGTLSGAGFATLDIDLMFALPGQSVEEAARDVSTAVELGAGQVSTYPLIYFGYTPIREILTLNNLELPSRKTEKRMLEAIVREAEGAGFSRTSIWSFNRQRKPRYTTVTRDSFVGIGAGASSRMGEYFILNTFSVPEYVRAVNECASPVALVTNMNEGDRMAWWFFWQFYNGFIDEQAFQISFGRDMPHRLKAMLGLMQLVGLARREGPVFRLTEKGAYLFHRIEQMYTHAYLERVWGKCFKHAWPDGMII